MPFEEFDKKIKEAADHHHPAYDEQAWTKMEKLLNKHLPQKEDDRRRFLFIILLFLGLGGAGLLILKPWKKDKQETIAARQPVKQDQPAKQAPPATSETGTVHNDATNVLVDADDKYLMPDAGDKSKTINGIAVKPAPAITINGVPVKIAGEDKINNDPTVSAKNNTKAKTVIEPVLTNSKKNKPVLTGDKNSLQPQAQDQKEEVTKTAKEPVAAKTIDKPVDIAVNDKKKNEDQKTDVPAVKNDPPLVARIIAEKADVKKEEPVVAKNDEKKTKDKKKKSSSFFLSLSAGPDISYVNNNKAGDVKLLTGAGLGYNFKDRLTFRTGLYSARKVYSATPDAYNPPAAFFALYPYLEKVDANCKVYEIPVSVSYNFGNKTSKNSFVSAGLSTFLMKEETYNYYYKYTPQGNTYTNKWTIKDQNSHFFSVATISAGYKKDIGKKMTVMAEPYFKMPLAGVGYGKVKLNSGGVLFTVGIKLF